MADSTQKPEQEIASLRARVDELEETLRAIRRGEVDGFVISTASGEMVYTLGNADQPYRLFVETMTEGAVTATQDGTILYCNAAFSAILRLPLEKIIGNSFFSYIAPDSRQSWNEIWEKAQSGVSETEFFLRNDGRDIPVQLSMKPLSIAQGTGLSIVVTDLTRIRQDQELIAEGNLATMILEHAGEALVVCDPVMKVLRSNPKADELFETPMVNTSLTHLLSSCTPLADEVIDPVVAWAKTGEVPKRDYLITASAGEGIELAVRRSHDDEKFVLMRSTEIRDNRKALIGYLFIFIDITARKLSEEKLKKFSEGLERMVVDRTADISDINQKLIAEIDIRVDTEKQLTESLGEKVVLLREVHHRVKNNLQIIISLLNLQSRYMTDETTLSAFRESQNRIKAMALVHEKLYQSEDISKINLDDYVRFLGDSLFKFSSMKGKGITLTLDIRDIFLAIDTAVPIGLMMNELIFNSLKYAFPEGRKGEISVAIHKKDHTLSILFADTGIGIPQDFDWRNAKSLGLRLVISLVEQLSGTIEMDRTAGTAFTIVVKEKK